MAMSRLRKRRKLADGVDDGKVLRRVALHRQRQRAEDGQQHEQDDADGERVPLDKRIDADGEQRAQADGQKRATRRGGAEDGGAAREHERGAEAGKRGADDERGEAVDIAAADQDHQQRPRRSDGRTCGQEAARDNRVHAALPARAQRDERCHRRQQVRNEQIRDKDGRIGLRVPHRSRERDQVPREPEREAKIGHGGQMRVDAPQKLLGARGCRRGFRSVCLLHIRFPLKTLRTAL